jgi:hypothetical protein
VSPANVRVTRIGERRAAESWYAPVAAARRASAGADDVVARLPQGLDQQLGATWPGGVARGGSYSQLDAIQAAAYQ